tara:strand:- start:3313 stop:10881 length:7569 start_codon:yes stop_codon:yes gene_type:complete
MVQLVEIPNIGTVEFPDGMSREDMTAAIQRNFFSDKEPTVNLEEEESGDVSKAFSSGLARLGVAGSVVGRELGVLDDEDLAESLLEEQRPTYSPETQAQLQEINEAEGFFETLGEFITNPRAAGVLALENIPQMAVSIPTSIVGGIVGSTTGPAGTAVGLGTGMALPTFGIEYGNVMAEQLRASGAETKEQVVEKLQDPEFMALAREKAVKRGVPIAAFEALSMGLAGKAFGLATRVGAGRVAGVGGEIGLQAATAAGGEASAQLLSEGRITSRGDIALEVALETLLGTPVEVGVGYLASRRDAAATAGEQDPTFDLPQTAQETPDDATPAPAAPTIKDPRIVDAAEEGVDPTSELDRFINELDARPKLQDAAKQLRDLDLSPVQTRQNMAALQDAVEMNDKAEFDPTINFSTEGLEVGGRQAKGGFFASNNEIRIDPRQNPRAAMAHEVLHFHDTIFSQQDPKAHAAWSSGFKQASTLRNALSPAVKRLLDPKLLAQYNTSLQEQGAIITPREARAYALELYKQTGKPAKRNVVSRAFDFFSDSLDRIIAKMSGRMTQKQALLFAAEGKITQQFPTTAQATPEAAPAVEPQVEPEPAPTPEPVVAEPAPKATAKPITRQQHSEFFEVLGDEGALQEYPTVGSAVDQYVDSASKGRPLLEDVIKTDEYADYKTVLDQNLKQFFPSNNILVKRYKDYADATVKDKEQTEFTIPTSDVVFVSNISEQEVIFRGDNGRLTSAFVVRDEPSVEPDTAIPEAPVSDKPPTDRIVTPAGTEVGVTYEVKELSDLIPSQTDDLQVNPDYVAALQPRDRTRAASEQQVNKIARELNPAFLLKSPSSADGAPVVGTDNMVESGNGRILALRKAAAGNPQAYANYRSAIAEAGFDVTGFNNPVLVRVNRTATSPDARADFVRESNMRTTLGMSSTEMAASDADAMTPEIVAQYQGGDINAAANNGFRRAFMGEVVSEADSAQYMDEKGRINIDGIRRIDAALFRYAYEDDRLVADFFESPDPTRKSVGNALREGASKWAMMRNAAERNEIDPFMDTTDNLREALNVYRRAKDEGRSVAEFVDQTDAFTGEMNQVQRGWLRTFFTDDTFTKPASSKAVADRLDYYITEANKTSAGADLIGDKPTPEQLLIGSLRQKEPPAPAAEQDLIPLPDVMEASIETPAQKDQTSGGKKSFNVMEPSLVINRFPSQISTTLDPSDRSRQRERVPFISSGPANISPSVAMGSFDESSGKPHLQGLNNITDLLNEANRVMDDVSSFLTDVADAITGASFSKARVKDSPGMQAKVAQKRRPASTMPDYIGARIVVDDGTALSKVIDQMDRLMNLEVDNFMLDPKPGGYRAVHTQIAVNEIVSMELQVVPAPINKVHKEAHAMRQPIKRLLDKATSELTAEETARSKKVMADIEDVFNRAMETFDYGTSVEVDPNLTGFPDVEFSLDTRTVVPNQSGKPFFGKAINAKDVRALRAAAQGQFGPGRVIYPTGKTGTGDADIGGFGQRHVKQRGHVEELQQLGFRDDVDALQYVTANHTGAVSVPDARGNRTKGRLEATKRVAGKEYRIHALVTPVVDPQTRNTYYATVTIYSPDLAQREKKTVDPVVRNVEFSMNVDNDIMAAADKVHNRDNGSSFRLLGYMKDKFTGFKNGNWITQIFDRYYPVNQLERERFGGVLPDADKSAYKMMRLANDVSGTVSYFLNNGQARYTNQGFEVLPEKKSLLKIIEPIVKEYGDDGLHLFGAYAYAVRANRLLADKRESVLSQGEITTLLDLGRQYPLFEQARKEYVEFNDNIVQVAVDSQVLSQEQADTWRSFGDYVPFYRILDPDSRVVTPPSVGGIGTVGAPSRRLFGGESKINNILDNMVKNTEYLLGKSLKNRGMQLMIENFGPDTGMDVFKKVPSSFASASKVTPDGIRQTLIRALGDDHPLVDETRNIEGLQTIFTMEPIMRNPAQNVVYVRRVREVEDADGNMVEQHGTDYFEVNDQNLFAALSELPPKSMGAFMDFMNTSRTFFSRMITMMPDFMLANLMRDTMATRALRGGYNPLTGVFKGLYRSLTDDAVMQELRVNGGMAIGGFYGNDLRRFKKMTGSKTNPIIAAPANAWALWDKVGQATEQANRLSVYNSSRERGVGGFESAFQSRDIIDYSLSGKHQAVQLLIRTVPFLNARAQGGYSLARGLNRKNRKNFLLMSTLYAGAATALYAMNYDDERYREESQVSKDLYLHLYLDKFIPREALESVGITNPHIAIPKPFELGAVSMTVPERLMEQIIDKEADGEDFVKTMGFIIGGVFKIDPGEVAGPYIKGGYQDIILKDLFRGRDLVPAHQRQFVGKEGEADATITDRTPQSIAAIARQLDMAPQRVQAYADAWFPKVGSMVLQAADMVMRSANGMPPLPQEFNDTIFGRFTVGRFVPSEFPGYSASEQELRELNAQLKAYRQGIRNQEKFRNPERYRELVDAVGDQAMLSKPVSDTVKRLNEISALERQIRDFSNLPLEEKRKQLEKLKKQRAELSRKTLKAVDSIKD